MAKFVTFKPVESEKLNKSEPVLKYKLLTSKGLSTYQRNWQDQLDMI